MQPIQEVLTRLKDHRETSSGWEARCPCDGHTNGDRRPSLSITEGDDGTVLLHCHAGHDAAEVCRAIGMELKDLFPSNGSQTGNGRTSNPQQVFGSANEAKRALERTRGPAAAHWTYHNAAGEPVGLVLRWNRPDGRKDIRPISRNGSGWLHSGMAEPRPLYSVPEVLESDGPIWIVEGEKCADALKELGFVGTTSPHGSASAAKADWTPLAGRDVRIMPDADESGAKYALAVTAILAKLRPSPMIRIVELPGLPTGGDIVDYVSAKRSAGIADEQIRQQLIERAEEAEQIEQPTADEWPELQNIERPDLPTFPTAVLPPAIGNWVRAEAEASQTPEDLAALIGLAVCSAAIARKFECAPWAGWIEPANLFVAVLLEPGNRKSAVFRDATQPLRQYESELIDRELPTIERERAERRQLEQRIKKLESKAAGSDDQTLRDEAAELSVRLAMWPEPVLPKLLVDDSTDEKLAVLLAQQNGRLASMSAEGGVFDILAGQYSKNGQPSFNTYLKAHAGDDLRPERVGRETLHCSKPALTCAYAIQPQVLQQLSKQRDVFRGRGLLGRFAYAAPMSLLGSRKVRPVGVDWATAEAYCATVQRLLDLPIPAEPESLRLDSEAEETLTAWMAEIEAELGTGGELEFIRDWAGKLAGLTVRLATVLHCIEQPQPGNCAIGSTSTNAAVAIGRYLIPNAIFALGQMQAHEKPDLANARWLVQWIRRFELQRFSKRDAHRAGQQRFEAAEDLGPVLDLLAERGYIRPMPTNEPDGPGRPPSPVFEVNPAVWSKSDTGKALTELTKPLIQAPGGDSVNCVTGNQEPEIESDGRGGVLI